MTLPTAADVDAAVPGVAGRTNRADLLNSLLKDTLAAAADIAADSGGRVAKTGDTMTGPLVIPNGTASGHAVNKGQLDAVAALVGADVPADHVAGLSTLLGAKVDAAGGTFTAPPTVPDATQPGHAVPLGQVPDLAGMASVLSFPGADPTGATPSDGAFAAALATGRSVLAPRGSWLLTTSLTPAAGQIILGEGEGATTVTFRIPSAAAGGATLVGIAHAADRVTIRDLTLRADRNGKGWCATHAFTGACQGIVYERVAFRGVTSKTQNWGGFVLGGAASDVRYLHCHYELLDYGILKDNSDTSTQKGFRWLDCTFHNCTDGIEINSPLGSWYDGIIRDCRFDTISQFPVGLAGVGVYGWRIAASMEDCQLEAVHIEDRVRDVDVNVSTRRCNLTAGTSDNAGGVNAGGLNGAVNIITGAYDIRVSGSIDLTQNTGGSRNGVAVNAGGGPRPYNVRVSATIDCEAGCRGVVGQDCGLVILDNPALRNPDPASKSAALLYMGLADFDGSATIVNPAGVLETDGCANGALHALSLIGDLSGLDFLVGAGAGAARTSTKMRGITVSRSFTANSAADWQDVMPAERRLKGSMLARFGADDTGKAFLTITDLDWDGTTLTVGTGTYYSGGSVDPLGDFPPNWRVSGGMLQTRAYAATPVSGALVASLDGYVLG